jgi:hydroxymethylbilane synthase
MDLSTLKIGTRGSKLALIQAQQVQKQLEAAYPNIPTELVIIHTEGDLDKTTPLHQLGGKGAFVKNIEIALIEGRVDMGVHSLKDITSKPLDGLELVAFLKPEAIHDALLLAPPFWALEELPEGASIATGSLRRKALLTRRRPDLRLLDIRGNVPTRVERLHRGEFEGLVLSAAGLIRLGLESQIAYSFKLDEFCPAPGQGVIALQVRQQDESVKKIGLSITDPLQSLQSTTELAFLETLQFDCHAPLGAYATVFDNAVALQVFAANSHCDQFLDKCFRFPLNERLQGAREAAIEVIGWLACHER